MISFLKKKIQILNGEHAQHEQSRVNAENEYLAMCCGSFNPRFLAMIKRCKDDYKRNRTDSNRRYRF